LGTVFVAIRDGKLDFAYPDEFEAEYGGRNPSEHHVRLIRGPLYDPAGRKLVSGCDSALSAIKNGDAFPPWTQLWVRRMLVSAAAFDRALFPAGPKQRPGRESLVDPFVTFLKETFPGGVPPGRTRKDLARMAKDALGRIVGERTVSRAIKKLRAGGTN
jgi:hypothetical protein